MCERRNPIDILTCLAGLLGLAAAVHWLNAAQYDIAYHRSEPSAGSRGIVLAGLTLLQTAWWMCIRRAGGSWCGLARAAEPLAVLIPLAAAGGVPESWRYPGLFVILAALSWSAFRSANLVPEKPLSWRRAGVLIGGLIGAYVLWATAHQYLMHTRFLFGFTDVGLYYERITNTFEHGAFHQINSDRPQFHKHFGPGLIVLVPLLMLWTSPIAIMALQAAAFGLGAAALAYVIWKRGGSARIAICLVLCYLLHPGVSHGPFGYSYGFHPPSVALPLLILSWHFLDSRRWLPAVILSVLAVSMQEHIAIYYFGLGSIWLCCKRWKLGTIVAGFSGLYVLLAVRFGVSPAIDELNAGVALWAHLGHSMGEILLSPVLQPQRFWGEVFAWSSAFHGLELVVPVLLLALRRPSMLLAIWPAFLFNLLRDDTVATCIAFQYSTLSVAGLFATCALTCVRSDPRYIRGALCAGVACGILSSVYLGLYPWSSPTILHEGQRASTAELVQAHIELEDLIPRTSSVTADERTLMHFVNHRYCRFYQYADRDTDFHVYQRSYRNTAPEIIDEQIARVLASGNYDIVYDQAGIVVLQHRQQLPPLPDDVF